MSFLFQVPSSLSFSFSSTNPQCMFNQTKDWIFQPSGRECGGVLLAGVNAGRRSFLHWRKWLSVSTFLRAYFTVAYPSNQYVVILILLNSIQVYKYFLFKYYKTLKCRYWVIVILRKLFFLNCLKANFNCLQALFSFSAFIIGWRSLHFWIIYFPTMYTMHLSLC